MQAACTAPSRSLVGPWVHDWPSSATPGPNLDELHEVVRFFDRWLRGIPNGSELEPALTWFERDYAQPEPFAAVLPGRWRAAASYPHPSVEARAWHMVGGDLPLVGGLERTPATRASTDRYVHRPTVGTSGSLSWGAGGGPNGLARDLRPDEVFGPTYTSAPLTEPLSVLGVPEVVLHLAVSAPVATAVVRLTDVAPDGTSAQVSAGILNLTHRRSHEHPEALVPGRTEEIRVAMRPAGYRFAAGHRLRVSVASSAWPVIWPSPYPAEFELHHGPATPSRLVLPVVPPAGGPGDMPVPDFKTTAPDVPDVGRGELSDSPTWQIATDVIAGSVTVTVHEGGEETLHDGRRLYLAETLTMTAFDAEPARASLEADVVYRWHEHDFATEIRARSTQTSDAQAFHLSVRLEVDLDGEAFFRRDWRESIPRRLV